MNNLNFSILIPTYKGSGLLGDTLKSILSQSFDNFEIIVNDDASGDNIEEVINSLRDKRVKLYINEKRRGYPGNLEAARKRATGDIIYLMGQDDILGTGALFNTYAVFNNHDDVGAVTRPYYWFDEDINIPVRAKSQLNAYKDEIVKINDNFDKIIAVFGTLDQLSGLAYRAKFIDLPFHKDIFPCHVYPFVSIFKNHPIVFLKDYNVAVRIRSSQSRYVSSIYEKSPLQSWVDMFNSVFYEEKFSKLRDYCIKNFVAVNYVGLVQIRNFARYKYLWREIWLLLEYRWKNIFSFQFWFFSLGCIILPPCILLPVVDWYKCKLNRLRFKHIRFVYKI